MRLYHSIAVFLIFLVSILSLKSQAQSAPALSVGQMVKQAMKESWADIEPLGQDDQGVYYMAIPYTEVIAGPMIADADFYFFLVNDAAELVKRNPVNFMVDGRESHYEFTEQINGKVIIFTSVENKKEKKVSFYSLELDKKNLQVTNPKKVVELSFADVKRDYERATFKSQISRDKSKLLISYGLVDNEGSMLKFGYVVLNSLMKETFKWSGNLDMSDGVYTFDQFRISNKGEVYLQTRYFNNEKAHDKNVSMKKTNFLSTTRSMEHKKNYEHRIVKFENNGTKIIPIPHKERFYAVFDLEVAPDGNLVLIGFYSPLAQEKMPVGAACIKVNVT